MLLTVREVADRWERPYCSPVLGVVTIVPLNGEHKGIKSLGKHCGSSFAVYP